MSGSTVAALVNTAPLVNKYITLDVSCPVVSRPVVCPLWRSKWRPLGAAADAPEAREANCCLAFSPCGRFLAAGTNSGKVSLWDMTTVSTVVRTFELDRAAKHAPAPDAEGPGPGPGSGDKVQVLALAWSEDASTVVAGVERGEGSFELWPLPAGAPGPASPDAALPLPGAPRLLDFEGAGSVLVLLEDGRLFAASLAGRTCAAVAFAGAPPAPAFSALRVFPRDRTRSYGLRSDGRLVAFARAGAGEGLARALLRTSSRGFGPGGPASIAFGPLAGGGWAAPSTPHPEVGALVLSAPDGVFVLGRADFSVLFHATARSASAARDQPSLWRDAALVDCGRGSLALCALAAPKAQPSAGRVAFWRFESWAQEPRPMAAALAAAAAAAEPPKAAPRGAGAARAAPAAGGAADGGARGDPELRALALRPGRAALCGVGADGRLSELRQSVDTDFPGPMYPVGYRLLRENRPYAEAEDETDVVVAAGGAAGLPRLGERIPEGKRALPTNYTRKIEAARRPDSGEDDGGALNLDLEAAFGGGSRAVAGIPVETRRPPPAQAAAGGLRGPAADAEPSGDLDPRAARAQELLRILPPPPEEEAQRHRRLQAALLKVVPPSKVVRVVRKKAPGAGRKRPREEPAAGEGGGGAEEGAGEEGEAAEGAGGGAEEEKEGAEAEKRAAPVGVLPSFYHPKLGVEISGPAIKRRAVGIFYHTDLGEEDAAELPPPPLEEAAWEAVETRFWLELQPKSRLLFFQKAQEVLSQAEAREAQRRAAAREAEAEAEAGAAAAAAEGDGGGK